MKNSLFTLACLAVLLPAAAMAQSVILYGIIDQGITKGNGGSAENNGGNGTSEAWQVRQARSSRVGIRGTEDMGGGLRAEFQIEHRFTPDTGAASNPFWAGRSWVKVSRKDLGSLELGRNFMPSFWVARRVDPFIFAGVGQLGSTMFAGFAAASGGTRNANNVAYMTPRFGGFTLLAAASAGEGAVGRQVGINTEYSSGSLYSAAGYERVSNGPAANNGNTLVNLSAQYDFKFVKPFVYAARAKVSGGTRSNEYFAVGATVPVGAGFVKAALGRLDPYGAANTQTKLGLGYDYWFSKRTLLYADTGFGREDGQSNNTVYALGVRHHF